MLVLVVVTNAFDWISWWLFPSMLVLEVVTNANDFRFDHTIVHHQKWPSPIVIAQIIERFKHVEWMFIWTCDHKLMQFDNLVIVVVAVIVVEIQSPQISIILVS